MAFTVYRVHDYAYILATPQWKVLDNIRKPSWPTVDLPKLLSSSADSALPARSRGASRGSKSTIRSDDSLSDNNHLQVNAS